jgi:hypothetical protein
MKIKQSLTSLLAATIMSATNIIGEEQEQNFKISTTNNYGEMTPTITINAISPITDQPTKVGRESWFKFTNENNRVKITYDLDVFRMSGRDSYFFPVDSTIVFIATDRGTPKAVRKGYLKSFTESENVNEKAAIKAEVGNLEGKKLYSLQINEIDPKSTNKTQGSFELQIEKPYIIDFRVFGPKGVRYIIDQK